MNTHYLSAERFKELEAEYRELSTVRRQEVAERLMRAKQDGDLSENAEYNEAKDEQSQLNRRLSELEEIIKNSEIIKKSGSSNKVSIGSEVTIKKEGQNNTIVYTIVGSQEANPDEGKISNESLVGSALLDKVVGDKVQVNTMNGQVTYTIKAIN